MIVDPDPQNLKLKSIKQIFLTKGKFHHGDLLK